MLTLLLFRLSRVLGQIRKPCKVYSYGKSGGANTGKRARGLLQPRSPNEVAIELTAEGPQCTEHGTPFEELF